MKNLKYLRLCLALGSLVIISESLALAKKSPPPLNPLEYQASYVLYWHGIKVGKSLHQVKHLGNNVYHATAHSYPLLSFLPFEDTEESQFRIEAGEVIPKHYLFHTKEKGKTLQGEMSFEQDSQKRKKIHSYLNGQKNEMIHLPLEATDIQDKITRFFQLRLDLKHQKESIHYTVVEPKGIKIYQFEVLAQEYIETPMGKLQTLRVAHISDKQRTDLWLAPTLDYLMVKLQHRKKNTLVLEAIIENL